MIDRAEQFVVLISPFVRTWDELERALARAVLRGVRIMLYTRPVDGRGGPTADDLGIFSLLDADIFEVRRMHHKAYLTDREAVFTSANLTADAVGKAIESALHFERETDRSHWKRVFEVWRQTEDERIREEHGEPTSISDMLKTTLRARAIRGDVAARDQHNFCIACGATASVEGGEVVCLRCRATAIAAGRAPDDVKGQRCASCNGPWLDASTTRPLCQPCFDGELNRDALLTPRWFVVGETGKIQAWWRNEKDMGFLSSSERAIDAAVVERWPILMEESTAIRGVFMSAEARGVPLWSKPTVPERGFGERVRRVVLERPPILRVPPCPGVHGLDRADVFHVTWTAESEDPGLDLWTRKDILGSWLLELPGLPQGDAVWRPDWLLPIMLSARAGLNQDVLSDPDRVALVLHIALGVPEGALAKWCNLVSRCAHAMLAALHSYAESDLEEWLAAADPTARARISSLLVKSAPLGPTQWKRNRAGKIDKILVRDDRVVGIRAAVMPTERYGLVGRIETVRPTPEQ